MAGTKRAHARWTIALAAAASIALAASGSAQTAPPVQSASGVNPELVKQHLTTARNTLSDVTQLPAASQLTGETRTLVQQLISNFNELIATGADWRASYARVESSLAALLGPEAPAPASGTTGAVGTSGARVTVDPAIRDMLVEFREDLRQFERVASGNLSPPPAAAPAPAPTQGPEAPASTPPADERPDSPPAAAPGANDDGQAAAPAASDVLLHVEAIEVILGAQTAAQKAATAAAGGAVVSSETASGSTKMTITGPDVTLNAGQLDQIRTHLKEIRRLLEKK
jgi:hypothetical protein